MKKTRVWRICHKKYSNSAFSGEGAKLYGGRFNSEGFAAVYTSGSLSLALLEILVRTNDRAFFEACTLFYADIPASGIYEATFGDLPAGWDNIPHGSHSQKFGDNWLKSKTELALKVPSVVVPVEHNYILNPNHPDFNRMKTSSADKLPLDKRLFG